MILGIWQQNALFINLILYMKKKIFYILTVLFLLGLLEVFAYTYFKFNDVKNLENYIEKKRGLNGFSYFEKLGIVAPRPGTKKIMNKPEFKDEYIAKDVFKNGVGIWDNGIDNKKQIKMLAIGDSFTVGIGAIDPVNKNIYSLIESNNKKYSILNLGGMGKSINDQKYFFNKVEKFTNYDYLIYNFFSGGDFTDNLNDFSSSFYIKNIAKNFEEDELQKFINKLNQSVGYKYYLEYLINNDIKFYSVYFSLKVYDLIILKLNQNFRIDILNYGRDNFENYPRDIGRLGVIPEKIFKLYSESKKTWEPICQKKYCFEHEQIFEDPIKRDIIIKNSSNLINSFYKETVEKDKSFYLVIHPSARNLYNTSFTKVNYNKINEELIKNLNKGIKIINLSDYLRNYEKENPNEVIFWRKDGHYTPKGYEISAKFVESELNKLLSN